MAEKNEKQTKEEQAKEKYPNGEKVDLEKQKKEIKKYRRNFWIFIMAFLLIAFAAAYASEKIFNQNEQSDLFVYNGYYFAKLDNGLWSVGLPQFTSVNGTPFTLVVHNTPMDVENIPVDGNPSSFFPSNMTYLSYNPDVWDKSPNLKVALMDLSLKLAGTAKLLQGDVLFNPMIVCSENNSDVCNEIGVINCANQDEKVISFFEAEQDSIYVYGNCITLSATKDDFMKVSDRLLYAWFGII